MFGVSLRVLSHFLPLQPCRGAHFLTLFYSRLRLEMHGRLLPCVQEEWQWALSHSLLGLSFVSHWLWNTPQMNDMRDSTVQSMTDVITVHRRLQDILDEIYNNSAKRCKQMKLHTISRSQGWNKMDNNDYNNVLRTVLCSFNWPARAEMRLYLSFQKAIFIIMPHLSNWDRVSLSDCTVTTPVKS